VADAAAVTDTAAAVLDDLDRIDVLVNNAGIVRGNKYFWETDLERDTKLTIDVNTLAPMYVAHELLPAMIAAPDECRMLNLAYAASKWAMIGWSDSVRLELKQAGLDHVKVTTVCPYYVRTGTVMEATAAI
jgi:all-trans-retinol dehydrogenase (NAD+)